MDKEMCQRKEQELSVGSSSFGPMSGALVLVMVMMEWWITLLKVSSLNMLEILMVTQVLALWAR